MNYIVNADDFGISHEVNLAIAEAFKRNIISNTTIMVNMPFFEEALELSKTNGFFDKVGLHLNFYEGEPLSIEMKNDCLFCQNGKMISKKILHECNKFFWFFLPRRHILALRAEANAQIKKYIDSGFTQFHIDSHGHSHTIPSIFKAIYPCIKNFKSCRISLNMFKKRNIIVKTYKKIVNSMIMSKFKTSNYFSSIDEFVLVYNKEKYLNSVCEIMSHPIAILNGNVINSTISFDNINNLKQEGNLISYNEIK